MCVSSRYVRPPDPSEELEEEEEEEDDDEEELYKTQANGISDGIVSYCSYNSDDEHIYLLSRVKGQVV